MLQKKNYSKVLDAASLVRTGLFLILLITNINLFSQQKTTTELTRQFQSYQVNNLQEKIFVHTDKTFYLAGEIIWFKAYVVDAILHQPFNLSKVVYVEIINAGQKPVLQAKIALSDATGNGSFLIPNTIVSGNYKLRAYSQWMKNQGAEFFYEQPLTIVNTLRELNKTMPENNKAGSVQFFPEGGNLVLGLPATIAFKAVNRYNEAVDCKGVVINQKKDTVAQFASLKFGMGHFVFTPVSNEAYKAIVNLGDITFTTDLPVALQQGYGMHAEDNIAGLKIAVNTNAGGTNTPVYLFVHSSNLIKSVQENVIANGEAIFWVDKKLLGDGISHITLFDAFKKPVCERLYFKQPENKLNITATTNKSEYATREKVTVEVNTEENTAPGFVEADMSVAVFKTDALQTTAIPDINSYLLLSADLKGKIDSPAYYFSNTDAIALQAADNLMLTQGWRRFKWQDVLENKRPIFEFTAEAEGHEISAKLINKKTNEVGIDITATLSVPDSNFIFTPATSNIKGDIKFSLKDIYGVTQIILQTNRPEDSIYAFTVNSPYSNQFSPLAIPFFDVDPGKKKSLANRSIEVQAEHAYLADKKFRMIAPASMDTTAFYGTPDLQYYLDDYTRFVTMEEVIKEYVADVKARKSGRNFFVRILDDNSKTFFEKDPLALIDGIPVFNMDKLMAVDPLQIKKLEIVKRRYLLNSYTYDGILGFKTYHGDLGGYQLDPNAIILDYDGLQHQREFYSPDYEPKDSSLNRIPDFRNQLFWLPGLKTNSHQKTSLSFFTSDITGEFIIVIQGITRKGLAATKLIGFNVKK